MKGPTTKILLKSGPFLARPSPKSGVLWWYSESQNHLNMCGFFQEQTAVQNASLAKALQASAVFFCKCVLDVLMAKAKFWLETKRTGQTLGIALNENRCCQTCQRGKGRRIRQEAGGPCHGTRIVLCNTCMFERNPEPTTSDQIKAVEKLLFAAWMASNFFVWWGRETWLRGTLGRRVEGTDVLMSLCLSWLRVLRNQVLSSQWLWDGLSSWSDLGSFCVIFLFDSLVQAKEQELAKQLEDRLYRFCSGIGIDFAEFQDKNLFITENNQFVYDRKSENEACHGKILEDFCWLKIARLERLSCWWYGQQWWAFSHSVHFWFHWIIWE